MKYSLFFFYFFIVSAFSNEVNLAVEDSWPPFSDSDGNGISSSIVKAAFSESNYKVKLTVSPYIRILKMTEVGEVDGCFNVTKQKSTLAKFIFGEVPLMKVKASFFHKKGTSFNYKKIEDFPDKIDIGVIRGYEYGNKFEKMKKNFHIVEVNSQKQLISMLINDRVTAAIMFDKVGEYYLKKMNKSELVSKSFTNHESNIFVAFSKKNVNSSIYAKALDKGLKALKKKKHFPNY